MDFLLFFISIMLGTFTSVSTILSDTFQKQFVQFNLQFKTIPCIFSLDWCLLGETNWCGQKCLLKTVGRTTLTFFRFQTVLFAVQLAINNRPLTFVDLNSDIDAITPNKLVSPSSHFSNLIITDIYKSLANDIDIEETRLAFVIILEKCDIIVDKFRKD